MRVVTTLWSKYKKIDPGISLGSNAYGLYGLLTGGSAVSSWLITHWTWFWDTLGWGGIPIAFIGSFLALSGCIFLAGLGRHFWRGTSIVETPETPSTSHDDTDRFGAHTLTQSPPSLERSLYVSDIRLTFSELKKDRHSELTMRVFNGSGRVIEIGQISGHIKFNAPNNTDPSRMGDLPAPTLRNDTARTAVQLQEWFLIFSQRVPAPEADKILAMLKAEISIHFDLSGLSIEAFPQEDKAKVERLPLWGGVSYKSDFGFGRIIHASINLSVGVT